MQYTCVTFLQEVLPHLRLRWAGFRKVRRQVCKRISRRYRTIGLESLADYRVYLDHDPGEWHVLEQLCRVTISRFYRDRGVFDTLRDVILPSLASKAASDGRDAVRVWSVGCASGEEPYSVSLCYRMGPAAHAGIRLEIAGTDIDEHLLERARRGLFPLASLKELPGDWIETAFDSSSAGLSLKQKFQQAMSWHLLDVRETAPSGIFDLVLCRNLVFTYFEESLQSECLERILAQLRTGGYLVVGNHESVPDGEWELELADRSGAILKLRESASDLTVTS